MEQGISLSFLVHGAFPYWLCSFSQDTQEPYRLITNTSWVTVLLPETYMQRFVLLAAAGHAEDELLPLSHFDPADWLRSLPGSAVECLLCAGAHTLVGF